MACVFYFGQSHSRNSHHELIHKSSSYNRFGFCYGFVVAEESAVDKNYIFSGFLFFFNI